MARTILYLDPWSGVSGDMLLASLVDSDRGEGRLEQTLHDTVKALGIPGAAVYVERGVEQGISCSRVTVDDGGFAPLRHLEDMEHIVGAAALAEGVKNRTVAALRKLAEVEAAIHGCGLQEVHFHEVGAVDTLVDVVGTFALIEALNVETVVVGCIPVGGGMVETAHGRMGVPAPATASLLRGYQTVGGPEARELTTPTGALLVGELGALNGGMPAMRPERIGYGAGMLELQGTPNILRVIVGEEVDTVLGSRGATGSGSDVVVELETNLDDVTPEVVSHACRSLWEAGALDVWVVPTQMKKGRPGVVAHALVAGEHETSSVQTIFEQTGTLGVRRRVVDRYTAARGSVNVDVGDTTVEVKWGRWGGRLISVAPEYEDAAAAAASLEKPLREVMNIAEAAARERLAQAQPPS